MFVERIVLDAVVDWDFIPYIFLDRLGKVMKEGSRKRMRTEV